MGRLTDATRYDGDLVQLGGASATSVTLWLFSPTAVAVRLRTRALELVKQAELHSSTSVITLPALVPATSYAWTVELLAANGTPIFSTDIRASTLVAEGATDAVHFAFGSCTMALPVLYRVFGFGSNLDYIAQTLRPNFMLLLGDQVYADVDGAFDTDALYRKTVHDTSYQALTTALPIFSMYDDHEIENNWNGDHATDPLYAKRTSLYRAYFGQRNPPPVRPGEHYYSWASGAASFFMLDVRKHASPKYAMDNGTKTKLGVVQKADLIAWLSTTTTPFKIIVSPMVVSTLGTKSTDEGWALYQHEYHEIFSHVHSANISGVVVLSGDLHWSGVFQHGEYPFLFEVGASPIAAIPVAPWVPDWAIKSPDKLLFSSFTGTHFGHVCVTPLALDVALYRSRWGPPTTVFHRRINLSETVPRPD
ncbi:alkaline phosphatase D [Achlya hypogyna]|uniref:Alkaline phosphatase D n=1 Tax=Achlya hypogyna TaxID=1202772 RepID=A0A1V9Z2V0_ACHHY|nr:alkaline phosphatase D [Achlya hypogyna]